MQFDLSPVLKHVNFLETVLIKCLKFVILEVGAGRWEAEPKNLGYPLYLLFPSGLPSGIMQVDRQLDLLTGFLFSKPLRDAQKPNQTLVTKHFSKNVRDRNECCFDLKGKCNYILRFQFFTCIIR